MKCNNVSKTIILSYTQKLYHPERDKFVKYILISIRLCCYIHMI